MNSRVKHERPAAGEAMCEESQLPAVWHLMALDALPQRLLVLAKMIERVTSRQLQAEFELSVAQWRVLAFICISGPATAAFIGDAAEVDQAEISRAVKTLAEREIVTREFQPGSRKTMVIAPSKKGSALFERVVAIRRAYFARVTQDLDTGEKGELERMLTVVAERVVKERNAAAAGGKVTR